MRLPLSNSRARACSALSSVSSSNSVCRVSVSPFVRQTLRVTVARSASSVRKLCSGVPSAARRVAFWRFALGDSAAGRSGALEESSAVEKVLYGWLHNGTPLCRTTV